MPRIPTFDALALGGIVFSAGVVLVDAYMTPPLPTTSPLEAYIHSEHAKISAADIHSLNTRGYAIIKNYLPKEVVRLARADAIAKYTKFPEAWGNQNATSVRTDHVLLLGTDTSLALNAISEPLRSIAHELSEIPEYKMTANHRVPTNLQLSIYDGE